VSKDVEVLRTAFKSMLTSVRFGTEAYYKGDVNKSQKCFEEARDLFTKVANKRGVGISCNNLGGVYSQQKKVNL
jgi:phage regulator Rha-like protein